MGRASLALMTVAIGLGACNALNGADALSFCDDCDSGADGATSTATDGSFELRDANLSDAGAVDAARDHDGVDADADAIADAAIGCQGSANCQRVAFVTSQTYVGDLGGLAGADAKCQALADASTIARIKGRTFLAWVSTGQTSPALRFAHGIQPYVGANGRLIAVDWADLTDGSLAGAIDVDEKGAKQNDGAWTGTASVGATFSGTACEDWTSNAFGIGGDRGNVGGTGGGWSSNQTESCGLPHNLYCFEK